MSKAPKNMTEAELKAAQAKAEDALAKIRSELQRRGVESNLLATPSDEPRFAKLH